MKLGQMVGPTPFPMGLWFSQAVLDEIILPELVRDLSSWGVSTFTLNAFPQADFHQPIVKKKVYLPDWTDPARFQYTRRCAEVLAALLPEGRDFGSISSLPLGWREGWSRTQDEIAASALMELVRFLRVLFDRTGKTIALALEPEPGCALERTPQVLEFWNKVLRPAASRAGVSNFLDAHLGLCYDTCHQAVQFEDPVETLESLRQAEIPIHKMQLSSALEFTPDPGGKSLPARRQFCEPKFLHQTRIKTTQGIKSFDDLPDALDAGGDFLSHPWRVHYHVPIHSENLGAGSVRTTRADMLRALDYALQQKLTSHFEVETYTWSVLPESLRPENDEALALCLSRELMFIKEKFPGIFSHV